MILAFIALIALLVATHGKQWTQAARDINRIPLDRLGASKQPGASERGPTYLLSALPSRRRRDDYAQPVSVGVYDYAAE